MSQLTQFMPPPEAYKSEIGSLPTMCQVHNGAYVSLLAPEKADYRLLPREDYHVYITRSTSHCAYARQTQANRKKKKQKRKEENGKEKKGKEGKERKEKRTEKGKERKDKTRRGSKEARKGKTLNRHTTRMKIRGSVVSLTLSPLETLFGDKFT